VANLLNFDPIRTLGFSTDRNLDFTASRSLVFDPNRALGFQWDRDLGFGKRGVLFRGFVCASCGALASSDAVACDECGAVFEDGEDTPRFAPARKVRAETETTTSSSASAPVRMPAPRIESSKTKTAAGFCPNCGARAWSGDAFCWNCGVRFGGAGHAAPPAMAAKLAPAPEAIRLPQKRAKKIMKDGQEMGKSPSRFAEEK